MLLDDVVGKKRVMTTILGVVFTRKKVTFPLRVWLRFSQVTASLYALYQYFVGRQSFLVFPRPPFSVYPLPLVGAVCPRVCDGKAGSGVAVLVVVPLVVTGLAALPTAVVATVITDAIDT